MDAAPTNVAGIALPSMLIASQVPANHGTCDSVNGEPAQSTLPTIRREATNSMPAQSSAPAAFALPILR